MNWYHNQKELWKEIIDAVSNDLKRNPIYEDAINNGIRKVIDKNIF